MTKKKRKKTPDNFDEDRYITRSEGTSHRLIVGSARAGRRSIAPEIESALGTGCRPLRPLPEERLARASRLGPVSHAPGITIVERFARALTSSARGRGRRTRLKDEVGSSACRRKAVSHSRRTFLSILSSFSREKSSKPFGGGSSLSLKKK